jgi:hypothetical protein
MPRQGLTPAQIRECLQTIRCSESEGEDFGINSENEYFPDSSSTSDEEEMLELDQYEVDVPTSSITSHDPISQKSELFVYIY